MKFHWLLAIIIVLVATIIINKNTKMTTPSKFTSFTIPTLPFHNRIIRKPNLTTSASSIVSIMNFNLLYGILAAKHTNDVMTFEDRRQLNSAHIKAVKPMILVTEETDKVYLDDFSQAGYELVVSFTKPERGERLCLFFHKESGLKSLKSEVKQVDPSGKRVQTALFSHIRFQANDKVPSTEFILIATHAKAGRTDEMEEFRVNDARHVMGHLLPEFAKAASKNDTDFANLMQRVVYLGDMNAGPSTYGGKYPCKIIPWLLGENEGEGDKNPIKLQSAFRELVGDHPLFTTCKLRDESVIVQTIDYVFVTPGFGECIGVLDNPTTDPVKDLAPHYLPFPKKWGSDHLSVYCEFDMFAKR
jgi:hypothetical protein